MAQYQAEFKPEGDVIVVTFPDVGYGATQGATEAEALEMAADFLTVAIGDLIKQGKELPRAHARRGRKYRWIRLPVLAAAKMELYRSSRARECARRNWRAGWGSQGGTWTGFSICITARGWNFWRQHLPPSAAGFRLEWRKRPDGE